MSHKSSLIGYLFGIIFGLVIEYFLFSLSNTIAFGKIQIGLPENTIGLVIFVFAFIFFAFPFMFLGIAINNKIVSGTYKRFKLAVILATISSVIILSFGILSLVSDVMRLLDVSNVEKKLSAGCSEKGFGDNEDIYARFYEINGQVYVMCSEESVHCKKATIYYELTGQRFFAPGVLSKELDFCGDEYCRGKDYELTLVCKDYKASRN